jgi:hypothetical protein
MINSAYFMFLCTSKELFCCNARNNHYTMMDSVVFARRILFPLFGVDYLVDNTHAFINAETHSIVLLTDNSLRIINFEALYLCQIGDAWQITKQVYEKSIKIRTKQRRIF